MQSTQGLINLGSVWDAYLVVGLSRFVLAVAWFVVNQSAAFWVCLGVTLLIHFGLPVRFSVRLHGSVHKSEGYFFLRFVLVLISVAALLSSAYFSWLLSALMSVATYIRARYRFVPSGPAESAPVLVTERSSVVNRRYCSIFFERFDENVDNRDFCRRATKFDDPGPTFVFDPQLADWHHENSTHVVCLELLAAMEARAPELLSGASGNAFHQLQKSFSKDPNFNYGYTGRPMVPSWADLVTNTAKLAVVNYARRLEMVLDDGQIVTFDSFTRAALEFKRRPRRWARLFKAIGLTAVVLASLAATQRVAYSYGYTYSHLAERLQSKAMPVQDPSSSVKINYTESVVIKPNASSLFSGFPSNPKPYNNGTDNFLTAVKYRLNSYVPSGDKIDELGRYVADKVKEFQPLSYVPKVWQWLANVTYTQRKKDDIIESTMVHRPRDHINEGFIKNETYPAFKPPRVIVNASRAYKNLEGPVVSAIDHVLANVTAFLKTVPVDGWMAAVDSEFDSMPGDTYVTDYTSFESSFTPLVKNAVENQFYNHMLQVEPALARKLAYEQTKRRKIYLGGIEYVKAGGRFSGDQRTSQANSLTNWLVALFVLRSHNITGRVFVQGDDGIIRVPYGVKLRSEWWAELGFSIKLQPTSVLTSGFCGFQAARTISGFARFGSLATSISDLLWADRVCPRKELLRLQTAKSLSAICQYPDDPIVGALAATFLMTARAQARLPWSWYLEYTLQQFDIPYKKNGSMLLLTGSKLLPVEIVQHVFEPDLDVMQAIADYHGVSRFTLDRLRVGAVLAGLTGNAKPLYEALKETGLRSDEFHSEIESLHVDFEGWEAAPIPPIYRGLLERALPPQFHHLISYQKSSEFKFYRATVLVNKVSELMSTASRLTSDGALRFLNSVDEIKRSWQWPESSSLGDKASEFYTGIKQFIVRRQPQVLLDSCKLPWYQFGYGQLPWYCRLLRKL